MDELQDELQELQKSPEYSVFQLSEYIQAFRMASDRARYVLFITTAVSLLMLIASWNYQGWSWSRKASNLYYAERARYLEEEWKRIERIQLAKKQAQKRIDDILEKIEKMPAKSQAAEALRRAAMDADRMQTRLLDSESARDEMATKWKFATWKDHEHDLEWYGGQTGEFYGRGVFVPVPGLGASLHVNDMAIMGGLVLLALTALLWVALIRQHENLYLASFKIRRIRSREKNASDGDSISNLLYHALAMAQVLSHPPTLARWNLRPRHFIVHGVGALALYFVPVLVHGGIVIVNYLTRARAYAVWTPEVTNLRLTVQALFSIGIATFCFLAFVYARSCNVRWREIFFGINRGLKHIEQRPWSEWVSLTKGDIPSRDLRRLARDITYSLEVKNETGAAEEREQESVARLVTEVDDKKHGVSAKGIWLCIRDLFEPSPPVVLTQRELRSALRDVFHEVAGADADPVRTRLRNLRLSRNRLVLQNRKLVSWEVEITTDAKVYRKPPSALRLRLDAFRQAARAWWARPPRTRKPSTTEPPAESP